METDEKHMYYQGTHWWSVSKNKKKIENSLAGTTIKRVVVHNDPSKKKKKSLKKIKKENSQTF